MPDHSGEAGLLAGDGGTIGTEERLMATKALDGKVALVTGASRGRDG
jgi:hypothetical protein